MSNLNDTVNIVVDVNETVIGFGLNHGLSNDLRYVSIQRFMEFMAAEGVELDALERTPIERNVTVLASGVDAVVAEKVECLIARKVRTLNTLDAIDSIVDLSKFKYIPSDITLDGHRGIPDTVLGKPSPEAPESTVGRLVDEAMAMHTSAPNKPVEEHTEPNTSERKLRSPKGKVKKYIVQVDDGVISFGDNPVTEELMSVTFEEFAEFMRSRGTTDPITPTDLGDNGIVVVGKDVVATVAINNERAAYSNVPVVEEI